MFQCLENWVTSLENPEETMQALSKVGVIQIQRQDCMLTFYVTAGERQGGQE